MSHAIFLSANLDATAHTPLFRQLYEAISLAIKTGQIKAGEQLPPSRAFGDEIGVSRATILAAYDQLMAEGYVETRRGAGVFATDIGQVAREWLPQAKKARAVPPAQPEMRPFAPGAPDMRAFPHKLWAQYVGRVARSEHGGLAEAPDVFGDWILRQEITEHLRDWRGVDVSPDQVVITAGAGDAMELVLQTVAPNGARVGLENPGYPVLAQVCTVLGNRPEWLAVDHDGACLPSRDVAVSVITPSCQFPLGGAMPVARRQAHLDVSGWLVEDDFDSEFRYSGAPVPALMALDRGQKVIYLGSFSKVFSSGLRIGYLVFPAPLIAKVREVINHRGSRASAMPQRVLARFMADGAFHRHVRKMRRLYRGRRQVFLAGIREHFDGQLAFTDHGAGMSVALRYSTPVNEGQVQNRLRAAGIDCAQLSKYYHDSKGIPGLHCGFCAFDEAEITQGLSQLKTALKPCFMT